MRASLLWRGPLGLAREQRFGRSFLSVRLECPRHFPISGSGEFLIGAPAVEEAKLTLAQGTLEIRVHRENGAQYRVKRVTWNGEEISHFKLPMAKVAQGGVLEFTME